MTLNNVGLETTSCFGVSLCKAFLNSGTLYRGGNSPHSTRTLGISKTSIKVIQCKKSLVVFITLVGIGGFFKFE